MVIREVALTVEAAGRAKQPKLSVIVPVYNEVDNLELLHQELKRALGVLNQAYEIVYINDGSTDGSDQKLAEMAASYPEVIVIEFRRNFGQTAAISAGLDHAQGDIVVLMDADLQNDPQDIPKLLEQLEAGYDLAAGWRFHRKDAFFSRTLPSMVANWLISVTTGVSLHDYGCTLKACRMDLIKEVKLYGEMHRFIPVFAATAGAKITEVKVNHRPRLHGNSKYGFGRTVKVLLDLLTASFWQNHRTRPMYLFGGVGLSFMGVGILTLIGAVVHKVINDISLIQTPLPQLAATLFALGIQSFLLGMMAELVVRTYYESQNKPIYVVRRVMRYHPTAD